MHEEGEGEWRTYGGKGWIVFYVVLYPYHHRLGIRVAYLNQIHLEGCITIEVIFLYVVGAAGFCMMQALH